MISDNDVTRWAGALADRGNQARQDGDQQRTVALHAIEESPVRLSAFRAAFYADAPVITAIAERATTVLRTYSGISDGARVEPDRSARVPSFTIRL